MLNTDKKLVGEGEDFSGHVPEIRNAELKFFCKVSLEGNSAHYTLSQTTKVKVETGGKVPSYFYVIRHFFFYFLLVWITEQPKGIKGVIGSPGMLHCKANGLGPITYTWFRSDTKDGRPKPVCQTTNEWYGIHSLAQKHWGYYVCHAANQYEQAISRRVRVTAHPPNAATLARRTNRVCLCNLLP